MSLQFKYTPLSFLKKDDQIKEQIRNTVILKYFFDLNNKKIELQKLIEGTQYGYNASALESGANKFLRISDITDGKVDWDKVPFCDCKDESTYLLENEDLLIARTGGTTGKSFLIKNPPNKSIYAGYLIRIRANQNALPEYLNLFLNSYAYWSQVLSLNKGEFRPSVNATKLKKLQLPKCSLEQQLIALKLSKGESVIGYESLTERIDLALSQFQKGKNLESLFQTQKSLLTQLKQAILQESIQGKLTHEWRAEKPELITGENSAATLLKNIKVENARLVKEKKIKKEKQLSPIEKEEIPFELPDGWIWCRLGEITEDVSYGTSQKSILTNIGIPVLRMGNITLDGNILYDNLKYVQETIKDLPRLYLKNGDLVFNRTNSFQLVGKSGVFNNQRPYTLASYLIRVRFMNKLESKFLKNYINSNICRTTQIEPRIIQQNGQANFNGTKLKNILIPLAPQEEQKAIVAKVEALMEKCTALEQEITLSEQHAQMLMQAVLKEAFEGDKDEVHLKMVAEEQSIYDNQLS